MRNYNGENLLEMVELYADHMCITIDSEEALSEEFDRLIMPEILEQYGKPGIEFNDSDMVTQAFNDWADELCKEGEIHLEQYKQYTYTGGWS